jgi:hypothetical protein
LIVATWFAPNNSGDPHFHNPIGIESAKTPLTLLLVAGISLWVVGALGSILALVLRFRRSTGMVRQQIKWFAYAGIATLLLAGGRTVWTTPALLVLGFASVPLLPAASLMAILRHRLYDIDLVINRTLVYGPLTVLLAATYMGGRGRSAVRRARRNRPGVNPGSGGLHPCYSGPVQPPLRWRVQAVVDRRFYRRKYDARKTLESFSTKLRNETELDTLSGEVVGVVREAMQPAHVSLWLRPHTQVERGEGSSG